MPAVARVTSPARRFDTIPWTCAPSLTSPSQAGPTGGYFASVGVVLVFVRLVLKHHTTAFHSISHLTKDIQREEAQPLFLRSVEGLCERLPCISELFKPGCSLSQESARSRKSWITSIGSPSRRSRRRATIFCKRRCRAFALSRTASSIAGQYFAWSGVSPNAALTISIRRSVKAFQSASLRTSDGSSAAEGASAYRLAKTQ